MVVVGGASACSVTFNYGSNVFDGYDVGCVVRDFEPVDFYVSYYYSGDVTADRIYAVDGEDEFDPAVGYVELAFGFEDYGFDCEANLAGGGWG